MILQSPRKSPIRLGVIGMGARACHMSKLMCEADPEVRVTRVADPAADAVRARMVEWKVPGHEQVTILPDAETLLASADELDALLIGTSCHLHAPMAILAASTKLPIFLEKPVAIDWEQLHQLRAAFEGHEERVVVSFPLRLTMHCQTALEIIRSGRLGTINQIQAINNVPYGGVYFGQWYRSYEKTGGLWLQKATHDLDYINHLMGCRPTTITAMHSRRIYGGEKSDHLVCSRCDEAETCPESPKNIQLRDDDGGMGKGDHACAFSQGVKHQDAGSAIVMYENGAHASYSQNFISRRSAGATGATVIGYEATLSFDWFTDRLKVIDHHRDRVDEMVIKADGFHGGGDQQLVLNFLNVVRGIEPSRSTLADGLLSAAMCLAARDAANGWAVQNIPSIENGVHAASRTSQRTVIEPSIAFTAD